MVTGTTQAHIPITDMRDALLVPYMPTRTIQSQISFAELTDVRDSLLVPYALHRVPPQNFAHVLPRPETPQSGDIVLAVVESIGKNTRLELANGRPRTLHAGDLVAAVFGHRYATRQFEGYARSSGDTCDLLSMGGLCGTVASKHDGVPEPSRLHLLGALGDAQGRPLRLADFGLPPVAVSAQPRIVVVCGSSMDAGKTHTAMSLIAGLRRQGQRVAGIKLTGTATGRDTWTMADAGACAALSFVDGGYPSTYLCSLEALLALRRLLVAHAAEQGAEWVVMEIADGLFQRETAALLQSPEFVADVDGWFFAVGDPLAAACGVTMLRQWGIEPLAVSGLISQSPLAMQEATTATGVVCLTAAELQRGWLDEGLLGNGHGRSAGTLPAGAPQLRLRVMRA